MKSFHIYHQPQRNEWRAVAPGWCWPAFFWGPIWALAKGMIGVAIGSLLGMLALGAILAAERSLLSEIILVISAIVISWVFGAKFGVMQMEVLVNRGFKKVTVIKAASGADAIRQVTRFSRR